MALTGTGYISTKSIRECRFYLRFLSETRTPVPAITDNDPAILCKAINKVLGFKPSSNRERFVENMELACARQLIHISNFEWVKDNDRACYWLWLKVRTATEPELLADYENIDPRSNLFVYDELNLNISPSSIEERYNCIVSFFDSWRSDPSYKTLFLDNQRNQWGCILRLQRPFKWLDADNEQQCLWAWEQLSKRGIPTQHINFITSKEIYHAVFAAFDAWQAHSFDSKELFLTKINKAWSQKKYRDNLEGKKPLNTYLNEETKHKLDVLSAKNRRKIHEMLEYIIIDAYDRDQSI